MLIESHGTSWWSVDRGYSALFNFISIMTKDFCFMSEMSKNTFSLTSEICFIFSVKNIECSVSSNDISLFFEHVATLNALLYDVTTTCYFHTEKIILLIFSQYKKQPMKISPSFNGLTEDIQWFDVEYGLIFFRSGARFLFYYFHSWNNNPVSLVT